MIDENKCLGEAGEKGGGSRCSSIRAEKVDKGEGGVDIVRAKNLVHWRVRSSARASRLGARPLMHIL